MLRTTLGNLLINDALPKDLQDYSRVLDKKGATSLFQKIAEKYPDQYKEIAHKLSDVGRHVATEMGGYSFGPSQLIIPPEIAAIRDKLRSKTLEIINDDALDEKEKKARIVKLLTDNTKDLDKQLVDATKDNPLTKQIISGARGNPGNLRSLLFGDLLYEDHRGRILPMPILRSFAQGYSPTEYFAGSFGARKGIIDLKQATADAGDLCISETTEVRMADFSIKLLKDISVGDHVLGANAEGKTAPAKVTAIFNTGMKEVWKYNFKICNSPKQSISIEATEDHKVLTTKGVLPLGDMYKNDKVIVQDININLDAPNSYLFKDKEFLGYKKTLDIEVANEDHLYVLANGAITSNSKQFSQAAHRLIVTRHDKEHEDNYIRGMPVATDDMDNEGALLAQAIGGYKKNTILTPKILGDLKSRNIDRILVRSPILPGPPEGGVYGADVGVREKMGIAPRGDLVGISAVQALGEPITQAQISCLTGDTLVHMADGTEKRIDEIKIGNIIIGANYDGTTRPAEVVNLFRNGKQDCYEYTFVNKSDRRQLKDPIQVKCTPNHKFLMLTENGFESKPIGQIHRENGLILAASTFDDAHLRYNYEPGALLLGLLVGDGCYTKSVCGVYFSCADPFLIEDTKEYLKSLNLKFHKLKGHKYYYKVSMIKDADIPRDKLTGRVLPGDRNYAKKLLNVYKMRDKYSYQKTLPKEVFSWNNKAVSELLAGLFATDGCVCQLADGPKRIVISYASTSLTLVKQIRKLLELRFGIMVPSIRVSYKSHQRKRPLYSICITKPKYVLRFYNHIKLVGIKRFKLQDLIEKVKKINPHYTDNACTYDLRTLHKYVRHVGNIDTYDLEVEMDSHLFVIKGNVITHNSKHLGGVAGAGSTIAGFPAINQLAQVPKTFAGGASHAQTDGRVGAIIDAPAGGKFILINGQKHYVSTGLAPLVKINDKVEAGDILSEGLPNPAEIVKHKGIGEGRRYFIDIMRDVFKKSNIKGHRRNIELLARGLINHIKLNEELGDYVEDDIVPYDTFEHQYKPRKDSLTLEPKRALNHYLEKPMLHYSIGTKIKPSMVKEMEHFGIKEVMVNKEAPPFQPIMIRARENLLYDPDWMTRHLGSNLRKATLDAAHRGNIADEEGTSFVPSLARGIEFGQIGLTKAWDPKSVIKVSELLE